jgi:SNF2 family DNA or RNA helicase
MNNESERTVEDIIREIATKREEANKAKESYTIFDKGYKLWADQEAQLMEKLAGIREKKADARENRDNAKIEERTANAQINSLERELERLRLLEHEKNKFSEAAGRFDLETINHSWREFAYPHQILGAKRLAFVRRGFLGDKMGLGKTLTSLIWADMLKAERVIVFAPKETLENFQREIRHWAKNRLLFNLVGQPKMMRDLFLRGIQKGNAQQYIILVNLEAWRRDPELIPDLKKIKPDSIIIDESHAIKSSSSVAYKGIKELVYANNECPECGGDNIGKRMIVPPGEFGTKAAWACIDCEYVTWNQVDVCSVKNILPMTGTPILNKPQELWTILHLIDNKTYRREQDFLWDFCTQDPSTKRWKFKHGGIEALTKKIGGQFIMRDRKSAGIIIPPQEIQYHNINFSKTTHPQQWNAYIALAKHAAVLLESDKVMSVPAFIALLTRFRQMMTWPAGIELKDENGVPLYRCEVTESVKLERAAELATELIESGEKVVLFSQFKPPLKELHKRLNGAELPDLEKQISSVILDGDTPDEIRDQIKYDFDAKTDSTHDKFDIVLCNYRVGGQSLNFTAAAQTIILDEEWNPGKRDQAYARTDRIGQTKDTTVHVLRATSEELSAHGVMLIDDFMADLMSQKENIVEGFEQQTTSNAAKILDMLKKTIEEG